MRLTFEQGKFVLYGSAQARLIETNDVSATLQFRKFADEKASRIFDRVLVKRYELPAKRLPKTFRSRVNLDLHQIEGVKWILTRSRSYLAHAPGAGKTLQTVLGAWLSEGEGQTLLIVPPSLTANWVRELTRWLALLEPNAWPSIAVIPDSRHQDQAGWRADWVICPDSMITKSWVLRGLVQMRKKFVAVDEASRFKEATSLRTIALFGGVKGDLRSPGLIQEARHAVLLDGSPIVNRHHDIWAPTFAMAPESIDFASEQDFGFKYCGAQLNDWGQWEFLGSNNGDELKAKLQKSFMHVVTEDRLNHPERRRSILFMSEDPRAPEYKAWERQFLTTRKMSEISEDMSQGEAVSRRKELGISKVDWIARYVRERLDDKDESILLLAWHRQVCIALAKALKDCRPALIMGGVSMSDREIWFKSFQDGRTKLLIGNIAAMGRGVNLQRADRVIFGEFSWSGETNIQAEKRASRRGSTRSFVRCEYVCVPNSIDEVVLNSVFRKDGIIKKVIG